MIGHLEHACEVLGIHPQDPDLAGSARRSFRHLAKTHHPDKGGDAEKFSMVESAYRAVEDWCANPQQPLPQFEGGGMHIDFGAGGIRFSGGGVAHVHQHVDAHGNVSVTISFVQ